MSQDSPASGPSTGGPGAASAHENRGQTGSPQPNQGTFGILASLVVGVISAGIIWGLLWQFDPDDPSKKLFSIPQSVRDKIEGKGFVVPPKPLQVEMENAATKAAILNKVSLIGMSGLVIGLALGIAHCVHLRRFSLWAIACTVLAGALFGSLAGLAGHFVFDKLSATQDYDSLTIAIIGQGIMLGILGAGIGLGFGAATKHGLSWLNCLIFGLIAGVLVSCVYAFAASYLIADAATDVAIPEKIGLNRLLWAVLVGIGICILVPSGVGKPKALSN